jgi:hypothetical protein
MRTQNDYNKRIKRPEKTDRKGKDQKKRSRSL